MLKVTHIVIMLVIILLAFLGAYMFLGEDAEILHEDLGNSTNINDTIKNITGNNISYSNGAENENYNVGQHFY